MRSLLMKGVLLVTLQLTLLAAVIGAASAAEVSPAEAKLRGSLRNTMLQMRTLQGERDTLQAEKDALEAERKTLSEKLEALTKQSAAEQASAGKAIAEKTETLAKRDAENEQLRSTLDKWKAAYKEAAETA